MGSRFTHLIRTDSNVFFFITEYYSIVYLYHNFCIHLSVYGHWWTYMKGSKGDGEMEHRFVDVVEEGESGMNWESSMATYASPTVK